MISQDPQSRAAGPSPLSRAPHFHDDTSPLTPSSRGRDPVPPRTQTGPIRALGRPDKNTQRPAAPMTVRHIRSDPFSITTSAAAWCEESAFVSAKTPPPPHTHTSGREEVRFRGWRWRKKGGGAKKTSFRTEDRNVFFSSSTGSDGAHRLVSHLWCNMSYKGGDGGGGRGGAVFPSFLHDSKRRPVRLPVM